MLCASLGSAQICVLPSHHQAELDQAENDGEHGGSHLERVPPDQQTVCAAEVSAVMHACIVSLNALCENFVTRLGCLT